MNLYLDIGNSFTKWAISDEHSFIKQGSQENQLPMPAALAEHAIDECWISCVAGGKIQENVEQQLYSMLGVEPKLATVTGQVGEVNNNYQALSRLGVDRWMAVLGARSCCPNGELIVVDAGTAVTVDYLSAENVFEGGAILPGVKLMHDALVGSTAGIESTITQVGGVIGQNTEECVNAGVLYGVAGGIERLVKEMRGVPTVDATESEPESNVVICGGDAVLLANLLPTFYIHQPDLVLRGLQVISQHGG